MANFGGVFISLLVSLSAIPAVVYITDEESLSQPFTMMTIGFTFLAAILIIVGYLLPPSAVKATEKLDGRGILYYTCCVFLWASVADLTMQSRHVELFQLNTNTRYFETGEVYLKTPFGITTQFWNAIVHSLLYFIIIYQIDNRKDCRNATMYWCGSILTSQFDVLVGAFSGSYSDKLEYSVWMNVVFLALPLWELYRCLIKPREDKHVAVKPSFHWYDVLLCVGLLFAVLFSLGRGLGALGSKFPIVKNYVDNYEPYINEPSSFGRVWILYSAFYGVPCQLLAMYGLLKPGCRWMINLSVFYASSMIQGTFTYMSYSFYPSAEPQYKISAENFTTVVAFNAILVILSHVLMTRCLADRSYFTFRDIKSNGNEKKIT